METQILMIMALCGFFSVSEAIQCYDCLRHKVGTVQEGDNHEECKEVSDKTKKADNCNACVRDTSTTGYDYLKRYCWTEPADQCKTGPLGQPITEAETEYKGVERKCCTEELCNKETWDPDSSSRLQLAGSLLAAILVAVYVNLH